MDAPWRSIAATVAGAVPALPYMETREPPTDLGAGGSRLIQNANDRRPTSSGRSSFHQGAHLEDRQDDGHRDEADDHTHKHDHHGLDHGGHGLDHDAQFAAVEFADLVH